MKVAALLLAAATATAVPQDPRLGVLYEFLAPYPGYVYAGDFLRAADRYGLDWRLLPAICVVESGCGKQARRNNMFGWDSGRKRFRSRREGIYYVAERLACSDHYKDKPLVGKLRVYNPRSRRYPARVIIHLSKMTALARR